VAVSARLAAIGLAAAMVGTPTVEAQTTPTLAVTIQCPPPLDSQFTPSDFGLTITPSFPEGSFVNFFLFPGGIFLGGAQGNGGSMMIGGFVGPLDFDAFTLPPGSYTITANVNDALAQPQATFVVTECVTPVEVDIKPGSSPNIFNVNSGGKIPVAILSSASFDASQIDPTTVRLNNFSTRVALKGKGASMASVSDINSDGLPDLLVHVTMQGIVLMGDGDHFIVIIAETFSGIRVRGVDTVRLVP
jgi:hypothetical protein